MEITESIVCLQLQFDCQLSAPLVQSDHSTKQSLEITQSFEVVFSSDRSSDRFTGKPVSQTTGLYYYGARWYDPSVGRFISPDPKKGHLLNPQTLNPYVYVTNDPTTETDPTGMDGCGYFAVLCNAGNDIYNGAANLGSTAWNDLSGGATTLYNGAVGGGNYVVNQWNTNSNFRTIVISAAIITVVVATGGLAAPILVGAAIGAGISGGLYGATCGSHCSAWGFAAALSSGAAMGSLGGLSGPLAGTIVDMAGGTAGGAASSLIEGPLVTGGQLSLDMAAGRSTKQMEADALVSMATGGFGDELFPTQGMDTMSQVGSPGFGSFERALMGSSVHTYNANMILDSDMTFGFATGLYDQMLFGN